jgi:hypothetical protein
MKAGQALGLLAGLGALNAIGGGREGTGKRFTGLMDMLDGGGAGASGDRFEGGGLLSMLGNLFAKPLEAQDNVERIAADTNATKAVTEVLRNQIVPTYGADAGITQTNRAMDMPYNQSTNIAGYNTPKTFDTSTLPYYSTPQIEGYTTPLTRNDNRPITADVLEQPNKIQLTLDEYIRAIGSIPSDYTRAQFADDFTRQFGLGAGSQSSGATNMGQNSLASQGYFVGG